MFKRAKYVKPVDKLVRNDNGREMQPDAPEQMQPHIFRQEVRFAHSNGAHVLDSGNAPVKGWANVRAKALFNSFKLLPLAEKIGTDSEAISRACEPAGGYRSMITAMPKRDVASRIYEQNSLSGRSVLVFDERKIGENMLANTVESGIVYAVKVVALVRGVPLAMHKSLFFGASGFWKKSEEFVKACRHLDGVSVRHPSAEKFNTTGNDELFARGKIKHTDGEFEFSVCVQSPRMEGNEKLCDFAFIVTNDRHLTEGKLAKIRDKDKVCGQTLSAFVNYQIYKYNEKSLEEWLRGRFSSLEAAVARLIPPSMKESAKIEWVLFREAI